MNFLMHTGKAECFDPVFSLMEQAFPPCERRNREGQLRVAKHPAYSYRILEDEQGDFLGFLAVWHFGSFRFAEHFAVNEKTRGMGIGSQALRRWLEEEDTPRRTGSGVSRNGHCPTANRLLPASGLCSQ